ncbi:CAP domain-containing protein [Paenibacillus foliorum]|uniref:CAP domain-containing protein n=1 Tax=Paenibacillus foliorum TaxID=2654974 RepID=UPI001C125052|nr:CAP domain-containing protein [Paenibacillus foliorum]
MVKFILLAVFLMVTGCTANTNTKNVTQKQVTPKQSQISTHAHTAAQNAVKTQASSTATSITGRESITIKEAPNGIPSYLLDLIQATPGNPVYQAPTGYPGGKVPTGSTGQVPIGYPADKVPTGSTGQTPTGYPTEKVPTGSTGQAPTGYPAENVPTDTTGQAPQGNKDSSQFAQQVLDIVNQERSKAGLTPLTMNAELSKMAMVKAQDMSNNNYFDHNSPTHGSPFDMMKEFGITYNSAGENIAKGQTTPTQVMNDWMNSPGHKANILNSSYTKIGIAYYNSEWVQEFTG